MLVNRGGVRVRLSVRRLSLRVSVRRVRLSMRMLVNRLRVRRVCVRVQYA